MKTQSKPLLHKRTEHLLLDYIAAPQHALLLTADEGSNYGDVALWIASNINTDLNTPSTLHELKKDDKSSAISMDQITSLLKQIKYKNAASSVVVVIHDAHLMSSEAQNRILKTIEEPGINIIFILTSPKPQQLLATIRSRAAQIHLQNPKKDQLIVYFNDTYSSEAILRAYALSGGAIESCKAILEEKEDSSIRSAKEIVSSKQFDRLKHIDTLSKDREMSLHVIEVIVRIYHSLLRKETAADDRLKAAQYIHSLELCEETYKAIRANGNSKLALTRLFINL